MFILRLLAFITQYNTLLNPVWAILFNLATKVQNITLNITFCMSSKSNSTTEASKIYLEHKKMITCHYFHPIEVFKSQLKLSTDITGQTFAIFGYGFYFQYYDFSHLKIRND